RWRWRLSSTARSCDPGRWWPRGRPSSTSGRRCPKGWSCATRPCGRPRATPTGGPLVRLSETLWSTPATSPPRRGSGPRAGTPRRRPSSRSQAIEFVDYRQLVVGVASQQGDLAAVRAELEAFRRTDGNREFWGEATADLVGSALRVGVPPAEVRTAVALLLATP